MKLGTHAVKARAKGEKRFAFITPEGGTSYLRIYAATTDPETAAEYVRNLTVKYPDHEFKVVKL